LYICLEWLHQAFPQMADFSGNGNQDLLCR
jgi:hypothetical protein